MPPPLPTDVGAMACRACLKEHCFPNEWRWHPVGSKFFRDFERGSGAPMGKAKARSASAVDSAQSVRRPGKLPPHPVWRLSVRLKSPLPRGWMLSPRFTRAHHRSRVGRGAPTPSVKIVVLSVTRGEVVSQLFASSMKPMRSRRAFYVQ